MKNAKFTKFAAILGGLLVAGSACATDSGTSTLGVSASVVAECAVAQNTAVDFGTLSMLTGAAQSSTDSIHAGSVNAICTNGTTLPKFRYSSAHGLTGAFRMMGVDTSTFIPYTLHQDDSATLSAVGYDTAVIHPDFLPDGTAYVLPLSAKVLAVSKRLKAVQMYSDTITVTTSFGV